MPYMDKESKDYVGLAVPIQYYKMWKLYKYPDRVILNKILKSNFIFD